MRILFLLIFLFSSLAASAEGIWVRPATLKQGEIIIVTGQTFRFGDKLASLSQCKLLFQNQEIPFYRHITANQHLKSDFNNFVGDYIARIPTTPSQNFCRNSKWQLSRSERNFEWRKKFFAKN
jgi:hypothetical protein